VIGWKCSRKERTGQSQFSTKFAAKLNFIPRWSPVYFFFPVFWNLVPYVTKQWVPVPSLPDFTDDVIGKDFTEPWTYSRNNYLEGTQCNKEFVFLPITPGATLFPSFDRWLLALQRTFSGLQNWHHDHRLHHKIFLAKAHLLGSFCRQLWWTLWNGQWDKCKVKVGKHNLTRQPLQVADPTNLPQFAKRSRTMQLL